MHTHSMKLLLPTLSYKHAIRLYDVNTLQCYVLPDARDQHRAAITSVSVHMTSVLILNIHDVLT